MAEPYVPHGPLGMGGAPLGNHQAVIPEDVARATVRAAWDAGIRHFDTAPHYGAGLSEHRMGEALRQHGRHEYTLSSKVGRLLRPAEDLPDVVEQFHRALPFRREVDFSYDGCLRSLDDSLQRLGLSRIDIVYIHDCGEDWLGPAWVEQFDIAMNGAARALARLQDEGVIGAWGFGVNVVEPCLRALERAEPTMFLVAGRYTLLDHAALARLLPLCEARDFACCDRRPVQFRPAGRRRHLQLRARAGRTGRPHATHRRRMRAARRRPQGGGTAVLRRPPGGGRRHPGGAHARGGDAERGDDGATHPVRPVGRAAPPGAAARAGAGA